MITQKLPSPHPYHEVIVNNTSAYLIVHLDRQIQIIYFDLLDSYRENAKVIDLAHARAVANSEIPF